MNDFRKDSDFRTEIERIRSENHNKKPGFEDYAREVVSFIQTELLRVHSEINLIACIVNFESHLYNGSYSGAYIDFFTELANQLRVDFDEHYRSEDSVDDDEDLWWVPSIPTWAASEKWGLLFFKLGIEQSDTSQLWKFGDLQIFCDVDIIENMNIRPPDEEEYEDREWYNPNYHLEWQYYTDNHFFTLMLL